MARGPLFSQSDGTFALSQCNTVTRVDTGTTITGTTAATVLAIASTKKFRLKYVRLYGFVTTIHGSGTANHMLVLADAAVTAPIAVVGKIASATEAVGTEYTALNAVPMVVPNGLELAAAGNDLVVGSTATIGTGVIRVIGIIAGDLYDA